MMLLDVIASPVEEMASSGLGKAIAVGITIVVVAGIYFIIQAIIKAIKKRKK